MMIYIYDILLNFCDNDLIYDFYEWDKDDEIENIKRIKLVHVTRNVFDNLLNFNGKMESDFLLKIYRTCEVYEGKKVKILDYCCLFSDGDRVIAIEFDRTGLTIFKSKLLLDEEDEIAVLASNLELSNINFDISDKVLNNRFLTRSEINIKRYLVREIEDSYRNKKYDKLKYLYQEYFDNTGLSYKDMKNELLKSMDVVIDNKHNELYKLLRLTKKKKQV